MKRSKKLLYGLVAVGILAGVMLSMLLGYEDYSSRKQERIDKAQKEKERIESDRKWQLMRLEALEFPSEYIWVYPENPGSVTPLEGQWLASGQKDKDGIELVMTREVWSGEERLIQIKGGEILWSFRRKTDCRPGSVLKMQMYPPFYNYKLELEHDFRIGPQEKSKEYPLSYTCDSAGGWARLGPIKIDIDRLASKEGRFWKKQPPKTVFTDSESLISVSLNFAAGYDVAEIDRIVRKQKLELRGF